MASIGGFLCFFFPSSYDGVDDDVGDAGCC